MVGYVALGLAFLTAGSAADAGSGDGLAAGAAAIAVVVAMHAAVRLVRLTSWGLSASLVAFTAFASDLAGFLNGSTAPWLLAAQFAFALAVGVALGRRNREAAANALRSAALLALLACLRHSDAGLASFGPGTSPSRLPSGTLVAAALICRVSGSGRWGRSGSERSQAPSVSAGWGRGHARRGLLSVPALLMARIRPIVAGIPARL
jgi:hypothetical protein